ncbi:DUF4376 domain-containing protein [Aeromonas rivipollensis]|uniref:DUF4376 domain-containing protein n=1 Tax=Aeromonas rivipollensis TaxID=948519 RepID=UPI003D1BD425
MYKLTGTDLIIRLSDGVCIPSNLGNMDYAAYLEWVNNGNSPLPSDPPTAEQIYQAWKEERKAAVNAIAVEVDGMVFDGDEMAQTRMARAVTAADSLADTTAWTLADNSVVTVTAQQLKTACRLAGEEQTRIWNEGRPA